MTDSLGAGQLIKPDAEICFTQNGLWYHDGTRITHRGICSFLARYLHWSQEYQCWVVPSGPYVVPVKIEDTPFVVVDFSLWGTLPQMKLNDDSVALFDPTSLYIASSGPWYCFAIEKRSQVRILRQAVAQLAEHVFERDGEYHLQLEKEYRLETCAMDDSGTN